MKNFKRITALIVVLCLSLVVLPVQGKGKWQAKLSLSSETLTLEEEQTADLFINGLTKKMKVKWKSLDPTVASVSKTGRVTAIKEGSTDIRAKIKKGKKKAALTCALTVTAKKTPPAPVPEDDRSRLERDFAGLGADLLNSTTILNDIREGENVAVSAYSIDNALGMTANGADGTTLSEMETALFHSDPIAEVNERLLAYHERLQSLNGEGFKTNLANGIWANGKAVNPEFQSIVEKQYGARVKDEPFTENTPAEINGFVNEATEGMIKELVKDIDPQTAMILVNAFYLNAVWDETFSEDYILENERFKNAKGEEETAAFLLDDTASTYFRLDKADGIFRYLKDRKGKFIAILPDEGVGMEDFLKSCDSTLMTRIKNGVDHSQMLITKFPEFEYEYETSLALPLQELGMETAFTGGADFSKLFDENSYEGYFISNVLHKTHVIVDREGAKAAAATGVIAEGTSAEEHPVKIVDFNRPFLYILSDDQDIPLFIGVVNSVAK